jgi:hypothetical protein
MQERLRRLSIPLSRWSVGGRSISSVSTPKTSESIPGSYDTRSMEDTTTVNSIPSRHSLPNMHIDVDYIGRSTFTEPPRAPPPAVIVRTRANTIPAVLNNRQPQVGPTIPAMIAPPPRRGVSARRTSPRGRVSNVLGSLGLSQGSQRKRKPGKLRYFPIICALFVFCMTAVVCIFPYDLA